MTDQEIRAEALKIAALTLALLPEARRLEQIAKDGRPDTSVIQLSQVYFEYLKDQPS